jgi:hypothetical protein
MLHCLIHFSHNATQLLLKTCCIPTNLKFSITLIKHIHFNLALGALFAFGRHTVFSQNEGQGNSRPHNDLNTTEKRDAGLTENCSHPLSWRCMYVKEWKSLFLNFFFWGVGSTRV